jgi:DNA replication protein DnaC
MRHDPASGAIVVMLRGLKMHGMAQAVTELMAQGSPAFEAVIPMLSQLLKAETAEREVRSVAYQLKIARFPAYRDLAGFDFASSDINDALVRQLHRCDFIDAADNVVLVGGPGTGKTHIATALGVHAIEHYRRRVRFFSTVELVNALEQEKSLGKTGQIANRLIHSDLVILDGKPDQKSIKDRFPGERLPAVQRVRWRTPVPPAEQTLRAYQRRHHNQSQLQ